MNHGFLFKQSNGVNLSNSTAFQEMSVPVLVQEGLKMLICTGSV